MLFLAAVLATACNKKENPWDTSDDKDLKVEAPESLFAGSSASVEITDERIAQMTLQEKMEMGRGYAEQKDIAMAEKLLTAAANEATQLPGTDARRCEALDALAYFYYFNGRFPQAEIWFRNLVEARKALTGPDTPEVAYDILKVANLKAFTMSFPEAEQQFEEAMRVVLIKAADTDTRNNVLRDYVAMLEKAGWQDKIAGVNEKYAKK